MKSPGSVGRGVREAPVKHPMAPSTINAPVYTPKRTFWKVTSFAPKVPKIPQINQSNMKRCFRVPKVLFPRTASALEHAGTFIKGTSRLTQARVLGSGRCVTAWWQQ